MKPTLEYLAASEVGRVRLEASHSNMHVVVENFSDEQHLAGQAKVYLSEDGGNTYSLLHWQTHWSSWWKQLGREWPPNHIGNATLDVNGLHLSYFEATYDGPVDYEARFLSKKDRWFLS